MTSVKRRAETAAAREEVAAISAQLAEARQVHEAAQADLAAERQAHAATRSRREAGSASGQDKSQLDVEAHRAPEERTRRRGGAGRGPRPARSPGETPYQVWNSPICIASPILTMREVCLVPILLPKQTLRASDPASVNQTMGEAMNALLRTQLAVTMTAAALVGCGGGGDDESTTPAQSTTPPPLTTTTPSTPQNNASGGTVGSKLMSLQPTEVVFEQTLFAADASGTPYTGLTVSSFSRGEYNYTCTTGGPAVTSQTTVQSVTYNAGTATNYAALMLFDRSDSMSSNDPNNLSLSGGRAFVSRLGGGDSAWLWAFPERSGSTVRPTTPTMYGTGFSSDSNALVATLNSIQSDGVSGNTPLYDSASAALSRMATTAASGKKTLLLFTDGDDTASTKKAGDVINQAAGANVPIYAVGLRDGNQGILYAMAVQTGGAFFFASDASSLVSTYGSLGALLGGRAGTYTVQIKRTLSGPATFAAGSGSFNTVTVTPPSGPRFGIVANDPFLVNCN